LSFFLASCDGSDNGSGNDNSGGGNNSDQQQGFFVDSGVEGLEYSSPGHQGLTGTNGGFLFKAGETTTFSFKGLMIGSVMTTADTSVITPLTIVMVK
jgi:hypothetical protein